MRTAARNRIIFDIADEMDGWALDKARDFFSMHDVKWKGSVISASARAKEVRDSLLMSSVSDETLLNMHHFFEVGLVFDPIDPEYLKDENDVDAWEPLPVEFDEGRLDEAQAAVERVIDEVRSNNGYADSEPSERETVLATLEAGQGALKSGKFTRSTIMVTLGNALTYLVRKFTDSAIGLAAKKALEAVWVLLS